MYFVLPFVAKFNIFPFISFSDIVSINELTLILTIIDKCDVEHIMTLPIEIKMSVIMVSTWLDLL